jgi:hypothetical protein
VATVADPRDIIIAPVILLQSVVAYAFMERHYQLVTRRLSSAVTADIAALMDMRKDPELYIPPPPSHPLSCSPMF